MSVILSQRRSYGTCSFAYWALGWHVLGELKHCFVLFAAESQALSDTHLGTADDSLDITVYRVPLKRFQGNAFFDITNKLCIPVGESVSGVTPKGNVIPS